MLRPLCTASRLIPKGLAMERKTGKKETAAALRHDIDTGRGRDKAGAPDPAAAPLGTDDEAAGTPISPEQVSLARHHEDRGGDDAQAAPPAMTNAADPHETRSDRRGGVSSQKLARRAGPARWGITVLVAVLAAWGLLRLFGGV